LPTGLVSGNAMVLRGSYSGIAAKRLTVRGRAAGRPVVRKVKASVAPAHAEAFVATKAELLADAQAEGLVRPTWLRPRQRRMAREGVAQAGRGREVKGFLDEKIFRNYLTTRVMPRARVCYNRALARTSDQGGRVVLEIEVGKGEVMRATVRDSTLVHGDDALVAFGLDEQRAHPLADLGVVVKPAGLRIDLALDADLHLKAVAVHLPALVTLRRGGQRLGGFEGEIFGQADFHGISNGRGRI